MRRLSSIACFRKAKVICFSRIISISDIVKKVKEIVGEAKPSSQLEDYIGSRILLMAGLNLNICMLALKKFAGESLQNSSAYSSAVIAMQMMNRLKLGQKSLEDALEKLERAPALQTGSEAIDSKPNILKELNGDQEEEEEEEEQRFVTEKPKKQRSESKITLKLKDSDFEKPADLPVQKNILDRFAKKRSNKIIRSDALNRAIREGRDEPEELRFDGREIDKDEIEQQEYEEEFMTKRILSRTQKKEIKNLNKRKAQRAQFGDLTEFNDIKEIFNPSKRDEKGKKGKKNQKISKKNFKSR